MNEPSVHFAWKEFLVVVLIAFLAVLLIMLYVIPVKMAKKRGRSQFGWFVFSIFLSPILAMVFLALLGESEEGRHQRIKEEERIRAMYRSN